MFLIYAKNTLKGSQVVVYFGHIYVAKQTRLKFCSEVQYGSSLLLLLLQKSTVKTEYLWLRAE